MLKGAVFITGAFNSGKTQFVRTLSNPLKFPSRQVAFSNAVVTLDCGAISIDSRTVLFLFGNSRARRFDLTWLFELAEKLAVPAIPVVIIIDSAAPQIFSEVRGIIQTHQAYFKFPFIIAANKQDKPGALSPEQVRKELELENSMIPIVPCIATDRNSAKSVVITLLQQMLPDNVIQQAIEKIQLL